MTGKVSISDAEAAAYYKSHPEQYSTPAHVQPESRDVRHILVKDKATADKIYSQLKSGGNFAALAKKYSLDPSKTSGGQLTISKGQTVPQFDKVAFSLKENERGRSRSRAPCAGRDWGCRRRSRSRSRRRRRRGRS